MEELDPLSALFSPEKALYSDKVPLPVPNVKALDNISKCRWLLPPDDPNYRPQTKPKSAAPAAAPPATATSTAPIPVPEPAPAQTSALTAPAPTPSVPKESPATVAPQREQRTSVCAELISVYETGPLSVLRRAVVERRQIKVWTRSAVGVKATLIGTPLLFDKHMNLVLRDVREETVATGAVRSFDQILLRGEHVILLALLPAAQPIKRQERDRDIPPGKREKLDNREGEPT